MKANTPQSAPRAAVCRHGFGGAHTQRSPERKQKRARRQFAFPNRRVRHSPGRALPGAAPEAEGSRGGRAEKSPPLPPGLCPRAHGRGEEAPGAVPGGKAMPGPGAPPDGKAVLAAGVAPPAAAGRGGLGL